MKFRYVVTQEGQYRHGLGGVYTSFEVAKEQARQACIADVDDYHAWAVCAVPFNMPYRPPVRETNFLANIYKRGLERVVGQWRRMDSRNPVNGQRIAGEPVWRDEPVN